MKNQVSRSTELHSNPTEGRSWSERMEELVARLMIFMLGTFVGYLWMAKAYGLF